MRTSNQGLANEDRVHVKGSRTRSAFKGTIVDVKEKTVDIRSDRNGGLYTVPVELVRRIVGRHRATIKKLRKKAA